ncbi:MAG: molecular chaperone TorD family protein [Rhodospirillaceae bacterium]|nr:molecular chaperone TorD family protein [Rhodospirillaceae bacterium]
MGAKTKHVDTSKESNAVVAEEDLLRANLYALISSMLAAPPSPETLGLAASLEGDDSELGSAFKALGKAVSTSDSVEVEDEFTRLFYGHGAGGELHPYASYYLTGFVYEKPLADLRGDLAEIGIENAALNSEPEDHIAWLCDLMAGLITGNLGVQLSVSQQKAFFEKHIQPWAGKFFTDLEAAESAKLYKPLGTIGRLLMEIERDAFSMAA